MPPAAPRRTAVWNVAGEPAIKANLGEARAVKKLAKANGVSIGELVRGWVLQNLPRKTTARRTKR